MEPIDLSQLRVDADEGAIMPILHPVTQQPTGNWIKLVGEDSMRVREEERTAADEKLAKIRAGKPQAPSAQELIDEKHRHLAHCTLDWSIRLDGKDLPFSPDAAVKLYSDPKYAWVREQVFAFIVARVNFLKAS